MITNIKFRKLLNYYHDINIQVIHTFKVITFMYLWTKNCMVLDHNDYYLLLLIYIFNEILKSHGFGLLHWFLLLHFLVPTLFFPSHANLDDIFAKISIFCPITITHSKTLTSMAYHIWFNYIMLALHSCYWIIWVVQCHITIWNRLCP